MESKLPRFLPKTWDLPEAIRVRLGDEPGRQRLMDEDGHLLLLLHAPPRPEDDERRISAAFWCNPQGEWKSSPASGGIGALQAHLAAYRGAARELDEAVERAQSPRGYFDVLRAAHPLRRSARNLLEVMDAARKARPGERRLIVLRDEAVEVERGTDLVVKDASSGLEFALAESGERQAHEARATAAEARRLNRLVAFFFPLATLVGVFSVRNPREVMAGEGFWWVLAAGVLLGFLVRGLVGSRPPGDRPE